VSAGGDRAGPLLVDPTTPECTVCGTCCFSTLPQYIRVFGVDLERMDDRARAYTDFDGHRCYMRIEDGHCAALVIDPNAAGGPTFRCSIYEARPDCCRWLERGSGACRGERHEKHERPLLAVEALLRRG
jgi:Fe-S-cluster containining protein